MTSEKELPPLTAASTLADIMRAYPTLTRAQAEAHLELLRGTFEDDKQLVDDEE